ncbi:hypothetical protein OTU49_004886, partial [Cherax quadricarinatus]
KSFGTVPLLAITAVKCTLHILISAPFSFQVLLLEKVKYCSLLFKEKKSYNIAVLQLCQGKIPFDMPDTRNIVNTSSTPPVFNPYEVLTSDIPACCLCHLSLKLFIQPFHHSLKNSKLPTNVLYFP